MTTAAALLLTVHLASTAAMVGLIWFVQVVHYPLFDDVGSDAFVPYARRHQQRTAWVVGLPMAVEGVTGLWLLFAPPAGLSRAWALVGCVLLAVVHGSTVLLQVPQHAALADAYDEVRTRRLVRTNWIRTAAWTARGVLAAGFLVALAA